MALGAIAVATIDWDAANYRVARSLQGLRGVMADSETAQTAFERGIRGIIQALETAADRERRLAAESRERMIAQGAAELPTIEELQPIAEQVQLVREIDGPDTQIAGAAARRYADWQRPVAELQRLQALDDQAEGALRDLRSIPYGQPGVVPEPPLPTPPIPPQATGGSRASVSATTPPDTTACDSEARQLLGALSFGGLGSLFGGARSAAARLALMEARQPLRDGATAAEMAEFSRAAAATLPVIRDVEDIGGGYRDIVRLVSSTIREAAPSSDTASLSALIEAQTAGADQITEVVLRIPGAIAA